MTIERLCEHIICMIHAPVRIYNESGVLTSVYVDHGEQQDVMACDPGFCQMLLGRRNLDSPIVYLEEKYIIYAVIATEKQTYLIGPCCMGQNERVASKHLVKAHGMNPAEPYRVFRISYWPHFLEPIIMLFEELTGKTITQGDILLNSFCDNAFLRAMEERVQDVLYDMRERSAVHNPYSQERREQEAIQKGDMEALRRSWEETYVGQIGVLAHDPLRQAQNLSIVLISLAARSAIAGGLLPELSFSMSDAFTQRVEEVRHPGEAYALGRQAEVEFCKAVRDLKTNRRQNNLVIRCKEIVTQQLHSKLTVQDLAVQLKTSPDYLSRVFLKEEGRKLSDYILREKVEASKYQLAYTDSKFQDIAGAYAFASHSHYTYAFKRVTGMTPKQYREDYQLQNTSQVD